MVQQDTLSNILRKFERSKFALKHKLTDEEYTLLSGLCNGMDYASIAVYMDCSESTVFRLQKDALKKMKAKNKIHGVAIFSREEKFIDNH